MIVSDKKGMVLNVVGRLMLRSESEFSQCFFELHFMTFNRRFFFFFLAVSDISCPE